MLSKRPLTLFGRATVLVVGEILVNAVCWIAAALTLGQADGLIGLALLAWVRSDQSPYQHEADEIDYRTASWYVYTWNTMLILNRD